MEMSRLVTQSDEQKESLQKSLKAIEQEKNEHEQAFKIRLNEETLKLSEQMDKLHKMLDEKDSALSSIKAEYDLLKQESSMNLNNESIKRDELNTRLQQLQDSLQAEQKRANDQQDAIRAAESTHSMLKQNFESQKKELYQAQNDLADTTSKLLNKERECTKLLSESNSSSQEMTSQLERLQDSHDVEKARWEKQKAGLDAEYRGMESKLQESIKKLEAEVASNATKVTTAENALNSLKTQYADLQKTESELSASRYVLQAELDTTKEAHAKEMSELHSRYESQSATIEKELAKQRMLHLEEMEAKQKEISENYSTKLKAMDSELEGLRNKQRAEVERLTAQHATDTEKFSQEVKNLRESFQAEENAKQKAHENAIADMKLELEKQQYRAKEFDSAGKNLKTELEDEKAARRHAEETLASKEQEMKIRLETLEKSIEAKDKKFNDLQSRLRDGIEQGQSQNDELRRDNDQFKADNAVLRGEKTELQLSLDELKRERDQIKTQLSEKEKRFEESLNESRSRNEGVVSQISNDLHQAKEDAVKMVQELTQQHQRKIEETYNSHAKEQERLKTKYETELRDKIGAIQKNQEQESRLLKERHESEMKALETKLQMEMEKLRRTTDQELQIAHEKNKELIAEKKKVDSQCATLRKEVTGGLTKIDELSEDLRKTRNEIQELQNLIRTNQQKHDEGLRIFKQEAELQMSEARAVFEGEMRSLKAKCDQEMQHQKELHGQHIEKMQNSISSLEQNVRELQQAYDNRPSRPEDVQRIRQLEIDLQDRVTAFNQLRDEMQFYKLELVNREQNYNKVFGVSGPNIGVLNPVQRKQGPQQTRPGGGGGGGVALGGMGISNSQNSSQIMGGQQSSLPPLGKSNDSVKRKKGRPLSGTGPHELNGGGPTLEYNN